jgi:hypothetical protein
LDYNLEDYSKACLAQWYSILIRNKSSEFVSRQGAMILIENKAMLLCKIDLLGIVSVFNREIVVQAKNK